MSSNVKVVLDSRGPNGIRLITIEATYPLIIHNELMTHRVLSRNTASNRAIPVERMINSVIDDPFVPDLFPKAGKRMQPAGYWPTDSEEHVAAYESWMRARIHAVEEAREQLRIGVHKEIANRLLGPFLKTTAVITSTHWANLMNLRCDENAQRQAHQLADVTQLALYQSEPRQLRPGEWHIPYTPEGDGLEGPAWLNSPMRSAEGTLEVDPEGFTHVGYWLMVSVGRCAGVSYLRQGEGKEQHEAFDLACRIARPGHWSPFEHQAQARNMGFDWSGNPSAGRSTASCGPKNTAPSSSRTFPRPRASRRGLTRRVRRPMPRFNPKRIKRRLKVEGQAMTLLREHLAEVMVGLLEALDEQASPSVSGVIEEHREELTLALFRKGWYVIDFVPTSPPAEEYLAQITFAAVKGPTRLVRIIRVTFRGKTPEGEWAAGRTKDFPFTYNRPQGH